MVYDQAILSPKQKNKKSKKTSSVVPIVPQETVPVLLRAYQHEKFLYAFENIPTTIITPSPR